MESVRLSMTLLSCQSTCCKSLLLDSLKLKSAKERKSFKFSRPEMLINVLRDLRIGLVNQASLYVLNLETVTLCGRDLLSQDTLHVDQPRRTWSSKSSWMKVKFSNLSWHTTLKTWLLEQNRSSSLSRSLPLKPLCPKFSLLSLWKICTMFIPRLDKKESSKLRREKSCSNTFLWLKELAFLWFKWMKKFLPNFPLLPSSRR